MGRPDDIDAIDFSHDREHDDGREVDAETHVSAAAVAFNNAALPPDMPEWLKTAIRAEADAIIAAMKDDEQRLTIAEARRDEERDSLDTMWRITAAREQREREEWARTSSTVAGVTMTGTEWAALAKRLRDDDDLHQRVIDAYKRRGMTEAEAEARYKRVIDIAEIAAIPPGQRTEDQTAAFEKAKADPPFKQDMQDIQSFIAKRPGAPTTAQAGVDRDATAPEPVTADPQPSVAQRQITLVAGPGF